MSSMLKRNLALILVLALDTVTLCNALTVGSAGSCRRAVMGWMGTVTAGVWSGAGWAIDVDDFLQTGVVANPMGVSGQAGKPRPVTGVVLRYVLIAKILLVSHKQSSFLSWSLHAFARQGWERGFS